MQAEYFAQGMLNILYCIKISSPLKLTSHGILHYLWSADLAKSFSLFRSSRSQLFFKIGVPKNFANFTGKHPCWSLFLIELQTFKPTILLKRDSNTGAFL